MLFNFRTIDRWIDFLVSFSFSGFFALYVVFHLIFNLSLFSHTKPLVSDLLFLFVYFYLTNNKGKNCE